MIYCKYCKSNNSFNGWKKICNGSGYIYKCKVCFKLKVKETKIYTIEELKKKY